MTRSASSYSVTAALSQEKPPRIFHATCWLWFCRLGKLISWPIWHHFIIEVWGSMFGYKNIFQDHSYCIACFHNQLNKNEISLVKLISNGLFIIWYSKPTCIWQIISLITSTMNTCWLDWFNWEIITVKMSDDWLDWVNWEIITVKMSEQPTVDSVIYILIGKILPAST